MSQSSPRPEISEVDLDLDLEEPPLKEQNPDLVGVNVILNLVLPEISEDSPNVFESPEYWLGKGF